MESFPADAKTFAYVDAQARENSTKASCRPRTGSRSKPLSSTRVYNLSKLEPMVAMHPDPGRPGASANALEHVVWDRRLRRIMHQQQSGGGCRDWLRWSTGKQVKIDLWGCRPLLKSSEASGRGGWERHPCAGTCWLMPA